MWFLPWREVYTTGGGLYHGVCVGVGVGGVGLTKKVKKNAFLFGLLKHKNVYILQRSCIFRSYLVTLTFWPKNVQNGAF